MNYEVRDLVRIAKRENNTKRGYLVVDPLQGKHIPVSPTRALALFEALAFTFKEKYASEKLLLVGFAETATAIGAGVAVAIGARYIQTTREPIPGVEYLFFSEEHSHATEQKLVREDMDLAVEDTNRIIFIEDEVTTGNTILNIVRILQERYPGKLQFSVASLLNGMSEEHWDRYDELGIACHYLVKTDHRDYEERANVFRGDGNYYDVMISEPKKYEKVEVSGKMDARRLVDAKQYTSACEKLWDALQPYCNNEIGKKILVIGTEECMYPALRIGREFEKQGKEVFCHSTTRSPIAVSSEADYPLHNRYELKSLYDDERRTFLYDIGAYDVVYIVTDALENGLGLRSLVNALQLKNNRIVLVRWKD